MASTDSSLSSEELTRESGAVFRRGVLHPVGVSFLVMVEKACIRSQHIDGAVGSATRKIGRALKTALPFIYAVQYQWLILLAFIDDHIIVGANMLKRMFPPSARLFHKFDRHIDGIETLPEKFENAMNRFPALVCQFRFLQRVLTTCVRWMNFLISTISPTSRDHTWEKEITVDSNCENINNEECSEKACCKAENESVEELNSSAQFETTNPKGGTGDDEEAKTGCMTNMKCSYKEVLLQKGKKQTSGETKQDWGVADDNPEAYFSTDEADDKDGSITSEDPILELFEASWHMNPTKASTTTTTTTLPTSYSFTS